MLTVLGLSILSLTASLESSQLEMQNILCGGLPVSWRNLPPSITPGFYLCASIFSTAMAAWISPVSVGLGTSFLLQVASISYCACFNFLTSQDFVNFLWRPLQALPQDDRRPLHKREHGTRVLERCQTSSCSQIRSTESALAYLLLLDDCIAQYDQHYLLHDKQCIVGPRN